MRSMGFVAMAMWVSACTATPPFPPAVMTDVETSTFDMKAWEDEACHPSSGSFVPHKVVVAGEIIRVIQKPAGLVILVEERTLKAHPMSCPMSVEPNGAPWFAVTFMGSTEPSVLQAGNRLLVVGTTYRASPEIFGGAPRMLPHIQAHCLHIWDTAGVKDQWYSDSDFVIEYGPEEQIICLENKPAGSSSVGRDEDENKASGGL